MDVVTNLILIIQRVFILEIDFVACIFRYVGLVEEFGKFAFCI